MSDKKTYAMTSEFEKYPFYKDEWIEQNPNTKIIEEHVQLYVNKLGNINYLMVWWFIVYTE